MKEKYILGGLTLASATGFAYCARELVNDITAINVNYAVSERHRQVLPHLSSESSQDLERRKRNEIYHVAERMSGSLVGFGVATCFFGLGFVTNIRRR